jgi:hypothetical protein
VPPFDAQVWFDDLYAKVAGALRLQAETAAEVEAVLPAVRQRVLGLR